MKRTEQLRTAFAAAFADGTGYLIAGFSALFVVLLTVALPNLKLLGFTFGASEFAPALKWKTAAEVLWNGRILFAQPGGWIALPLAALFGLNAALVARYMREQVRLNRAAGASALGIAVGLLGVGCAACGSVVLTSLLGIGAAALLPFHGQEFAWLGLTLLALSTLAIAEKLADPAACKVPSRK